MLLTIAFAFCAVMAFGGIVSAQDTTPLQNVIQTSGTGTVLGTPDRVQLSFSVQTENADVKTAQSENAARMTQVINALATAGVPKDSMKTTGYTIYPVYQDTSNPLTSKVQTYQVTNTLQVTLTDVTKSGDVIDVAVASGINQISSIQFMLSDAQSLALRNEALKKAVINARNDADTVAGALGVNITGTKNVDISQGYTPVAYDNIAMGGALTKSAMVPTPIQPNDVTVTAQVSVSYTYN